MMAKGVSLPRDGKRNGRDSRPSTATVVVERKMLACGPAACHSGPGFSIFLLYRPVLAGGEEKKREREGETINTIYIYVYACRLYAYICMCMCTYVIHTFIERGGEQRETETRTEMEQRWK